MDAAQPGDRILVPQGTWAGAVVMKKVEIRGTGDAHIVVGPLVRGAKTMGFQIGEAETGANGDGVTIANLTFETGVDLPVYSRGANGVTVAGNTFMNTYQGVTNRGGKRWVITNNTFHDLRTSNGGGIAVLLADQSGRAVEYNFVAHNKISGTVHVSVGDGGGYDAAAIALYADFRYNQQGAVSVAHNRVVKNTVALESDNAGVVDVIAFQMADSSDGTNVIHDNVVGFNNFSGTARQIDYSPAALDANNHVSRNLGLASGGGDFDGDGMTDITVFRPSTGTWGIIYSSMGTKAGTSWGNATDRLVPADYDGDGKTDLAVFRPSTGTWGIMYSETGTTEGIQWGLADDKLVPADYDGDGKTDLAVFRPSTGTWGIIYSATGTRAGVPWGGVGDVPVPADYDGDGKTDIAVFRPATGDWGIIYSSTGTSAGVQWGRVGDVPMPADYDGDGKTDIAIFRPSTGDWGIIYSATGTRAGVRWGKANDVLVPADYDGDGKTDIAVYRPSTGDWGIIYSTTGTGAGVRWGSAGDVAMPADYDGDGKTDIAVYRPSTGDWGIIYSTTGTGAGTKWGVSGDVAMPKR